MDITLKISDDSKMIIALCVDYEETIEVYDEVTGVTSSIPNPVTKRKYMKKMIVSLMKRKTKQHYHQLDETIFNTALIAKKEEIDNENVG